MSKGISIRRGRLVKSEMRESMALTEKYFGTASDPEQAPIIPDNAVWLRTHIASCLNIIRYKGKMIGLSLIYPCAKKIMDDFISRKINEAELLDEMKKAAANRRPEAIYLCSAFVEPEFRGRGLALKSIILSIKKTFDLKKRPPIFYWAYSNEGGKLAVKVASVLGLEIYKRTD